jgi:hypothetical protein
MVMAGLVLICALGVSCAPGQDFNTRLNSIVRPYHFNIVRWQFNAIFDEAKKLIFERDKRSDDEISKIEDFFSATEQIKVLESEIEAVKAGSKSGDLTALEAELNEWHQQKAALESLVERIIEKQIRETLSQQGIFNPIDRYIRLKIGFPPVNFKLEEPPHLLVVSPRDRIESIREIVLRKALNLEEKKAIEAEADKLGISSLVVELGGFGGTYPTFVTDRASLQFTLDAAAEEWLHQYLAFKPLGFRYLLDLTGISRNYEVATMNETVASMVAKEVGSLIYEDYYTQLENGKDQSEASVSGFDFNLEMRNIRRTVDNYLAQGEIEQAEEFMEQKRQFLATKGYHIRKLNQAYFAFHGAYADRPTSISPIGRELKELRNQSASLKDFLEKAATMTSRQDLVESLKQGS